MRGKLKQRTFGQMVYTLIPLFVAWSVGMCWFFQWWEASLPQEPVPEPVSLARSEHNKAFWQHVYADTNLVMLIISKETLRLHAICYNGLLHKSYPVAVGRGYGAKRRLGDLTTPQGMFTIASITNATGATHNFHDGRGEVRGAYGHWFMRIDVPGYPHIGLHGNCNKRSIGTRASLGCVRMYNDQLDELRPRVYPGIRVLITPGKADKKADVGRPPAPVWTHADAAKEQKKEAAAKEDVLVKEALEISD